MTKRTRKFSRSALLPAALVALVLGAGCGNGSETLTGTETIPQWTPQADPAWNTHDKKGGVPQVTTTKTNPGSAPEAGKTREPSSTPVTQGEPQAQHGPVTLIIERYVGGVRHTMGTLSFDATGHATLTVDADGEEGAQLRAAWAAISAQDSLALEYEDIVEEDGDRVRRHMARVVARGAAEYPDAVWSTLESSHGYLVDKQY